MIQPNFHSLDSTYSEISFDPRINENKAKLLLRVLAVDFVIDPIEKDSDPQASLLACELCSSRSESPQAYCQAFAWLLKSTQELFWKIPVPTNPLTPEQLKTLHLALWIERIDRKIAALVREFFIDGVLDETKYSDYRTKNVAQLRNVVRYFRRYAEPEYWRMLRDELPSSKDLLSRTAPDLIEDFVTGGIGFVVKACQRAIHSRAKAHQHL